MVFAGGHALREIITDQGTDFMSQTVKQLCKLLKIKSVKISVYHPQTNRLTEQFNRTLKKMLRKFEAMDAHHWDHVIGTKAPVTLRGDSS